jgi:GH35 family endo-1,4-beta-xylanase
VDFLDFMNEPNEIRDDFTNPMARWLRRIGPDEAVRLAWEACEAFDLPAHGIINHYLRDDSFFNVCRALVDNGRLPRAIGLQSHQHRGTRPLWNFTEETDRFSSLGRPVHWTENSIVSGENRFVRFIDGKADVPPWPSRPEGERRQADELAAQYTVLFGHPQVEAVTQWSFTDACSWLGAPSGLLDENLQPKPGYAALHELIRRQWWSNADLVTDAAGEATARVFRGEYELTLVAEGEPESKTVACHVDSPAVRVVID